MTIYYRNTSTRKVFKSTKISALSRLYLILDKWKKSGGFFKVFETFLSPVVYMWQRYVPIANIGEYRYSTSNKKFSYNAQNIQHEAIYNPVFDRGYEPEVGALLDIVLEQKNTFYDIGSNWGYFSLFAAASPKYSGKVFAFEPFPSTFLDLCQAVKQAGLESRITCLPVALGRKAGNAKMQFLSALQSGWAALINEGDHKAKNFLYQKAHVTVTTLDQVAADPPTIMKVDVEGSENEVFLGGRLLINKFRPHIIFESSLAHDNIAQTLDPLSTLTNWGYKLFYPCWLNKHGSMSYLSHVIKKDPNSKYFKFALVPITQETRYLLGPQINLFACHSSKLDAVKRKFTKHVDYCVLKK